MNRICIINIELNHPDTIRDGIFDFFQEAPKEVHPVTPKLEGLSFKSVSEPSKTMLIEPFSRKEIQKAVFSCGRSKAPGPDGFDFALIQAKWELIKEDIFRFMDMFWITEEMAFQLNATFITLIPQMAHPLKITDYRPFSMVGVLYKIVSKVLAGRIEKVMPEIISPT